jgi:hypothetical protein
VYSAGDWQFVNAAPSSEHAKLDPDSSEENSNRALPLDVASGLESMVVCGARVSGSSIVHA